jgi:putative Holliday junction resolvase
VQEKEILNHLELADLSRIPAQGRILALDPGTKRIGLAICDEDRVVTTPLLRIERTSWKKLLSEIKQLLQQFDAKALVIGLPLESDGNESEMSSEARQMARKFDLSLEVPVFLQDERVTSYEAKRRLWDKGAANAKDLVDSEAATLILSDFLDRLRTNSDATSVLKS